MTYFYISIVFLYQKFVHGSLHSFERVIRWWIVCVNSVSDHILICTLNLNLLLSTCIIYHEVKVTANIISSCYVSNLSVLHVINWESESPGLWNVRYTLLPCIIHKPNMIWSSNCLSVIIRNWKSLIFYLILEFPLDDLVITVAYLFFRVIYNSMIPNSFIMT